MIDKQLDALNLPADVLEKLGRAGAYSRTIIRLFTCECGMYKLPKPLTVEDVRRMSEAEIYKIISYRYG